MRHSSAKVPPRPTGLELGRIPDQTSRQSWDGRVSYDRRRLAVQTIPLSSTTTVVPAGSR